MGKVMEHLMALIQVAVMDLMWDISMDDSLVAL